MADYVPLHNNNNADTLLATNKSALVQASQRSHLYINPTNSTGGEMALPFIWYFNALDTVSTDIASMGRIYFREMNGLKHANGSTTNVSLAMYIWAENVEMSASTMVNPTTIVTQAADEYGSTPISNTASAIADAAGKLSMSPMIGPYAKATQMAVGSIGAVAKMFGYSRPAAIENETKMRPKIMSRLANTDCGDGSVRLTVDSKQELTIDPKVCGVNEDDCMSIKSIATRESYLTSFNWNVGSLDNARLWNIRVGPMVSVADTTYTPTMYWMPACAFASLPFRYWRGTMRYRFQVVCSEYHRGRLKFVYDPHAVTGTPEANMGYTRVVDLEKEREFSMDIGMSQSRSFIYMGDVENASTVYGTTAITTANLFGNGTLAVFVATELTTPNSTVNNDISINVFISTCDDIDYAEPTSASLARVTYSTQAEDEIAPDESAPIKVENDESAMQCLDVDHTHDVHFGETYSSFRALLKRSAYQGSWLCPTVGDSMWKLILHNFPYPRGRFAQAVNVDSTAAKANLVPTCLFTYLYPAYLCMRGSVRWKYLYYSDKDSNLTYMKVARVPGTVIPASNTTSTTIITNNNAFLVSRGFVESNGFEGLDVTYTKAQPVLEFEVPYYSNARFITCKDLATTSSELSPQNAVHAITIDNHSTGVSYIDRYVSTGEDFSLVLFQGAPPVKLTTLAAS